MMNTYDWKRPLATRGPNQGETSMQDIAATSIGTLLGITPIKKGVEYVRNNFPRVHSFITNPIYRKNFINRHFGELEKQPVNYEQYTNQYSPNLQYSNTFVDLSKNAYSTQTFAPDNANSALFNEFLEFSNPAIFPASHWKTLPLNYKIGDGNIPLKDISLFQGVENGTYKIGALDSFHDNTVVIPVRTAKSPGIMSITGTRDYDKKLKQWESETRIAEINAKAALNKYLDEVERQRANWHNTQLPKLRELLLTHGYDTTGVTSVPYTDNDELNQKLEKLEFDTNEKADSLLNNSIILENKRDSLYGVRPKRFTINFADGTSKSSLNFSGKFTLGNSKGGFFFNNPDLLQVPSITDSLNNFINKTGEPLYPAIQDDGGYFEHINNSKPIPEIVQKYWEQGYGQPPTNVSFIVGTTK